MAKTAVSIDLCFCNGIKLRLMRASALNSIQQFYFTNPKLLLNRITGKTLSTSPSFLHMG
jgi:hypothetical protein